VSSEVPSAADPFRLVGETVAGRFRVERHVAEGGFGVVYRAQQLALGRPVALKVLREPQGLPASERDELHRSFEREARAIARLKHRHIVEVHDFGVSELAGGAVQRWMVLEWLEGETLEALLRRTAAGRMAPAQALELLRPVIQAIGFAHRNGVVHRDLKPSNLFLAARDDGVVPTVLDFGIAALSEGAPPEKGAPIAAAGTTRGFAAFSPDYAAPEQVSYGRTGPWTDVHALGLILSELLTGEPPYPPGEPEERLAAVVSDRRPTPASKGVAVPGLEPVLARALARRPADRYPDADALQSALASAPLRISGRRRPALLAVAALVVVAGTMLAWWAIDRRTPGDASAPVKIAVLPFENLTGDPRQEYLSDGLTDGMVGHLGRLLPQRLSVIARTSVIRYKGSRKSAHEIGRELGVGYLLTASVSRNGEPLRVDAHLTRASDESEIWSDRFERDVRDVMGLQTEMAQAVGWAIRLKLGGRAREAITRNQPVKPAAYEAYLRARFFDTEDDPARHRMRVAGFEEAIRLDPAFAAAYAGLANAIADNVFLPARETLPKSKAAALRALQLDDELPAGHTVLGRALLTFDWDWKGAEGHFRRALEMDASDPETLLFSAQYYLSIGRFDEAIALRARAIELDPLGPFVKWALGSAYYYARQYDAAIAQLEGVVADDPNAVNPRIHLARAYVQKGAFSEAAEQARRALEHHPVWHLGTLGYVLARAGASGEALAVLDRVATLSKARSVSSLDVARVHVGLGRNDEAFRWLNQALDARDSDLIYLRIEPTWDSIRTDPRFAALIRQVGIPELGTASL
jgi:TolB-like protein/Flp pilus assembly protein TadD